jgi:hypothetical protein
MTDDVLKVNTIRLLVAPPKAGIEGATFGPLGIGLSVLRAVTTDNVDPTVLLATVSK